MKKKIIGSIAVAGVLIGGMSACSDAEVVNDNITKDADNFKIARRIVFVNGITDKYHLSIEGFCNITATPEQLEVICKTDAGYKKHFLGLSDNTTYFVEQVDAAAVSSDHYKVVFKPSVVVPVGEAR